MCLVFEVVWEDLCYLLCLVFEVVWSISRDLFCLVFEVERISGTSCVLFLKWVEIISAPFVSNFWSSLKKFRGFLVLFFWSMLFGTSCVLVFEVGWKNLEDSLCFGSESPRSLASSFWRSFNYLGHPPCFIFEVGWKNPKNPLCLHFEEVWKNLEHLLCLVFEVVWSISRDLFYLVFEVVLSISGTSCVWFLK